MKRPAFQFYPDDWLGDINLNLCSLGAQGLWLRLMCFMHQGEPYGYLRVKGEVIPPDMVPELVGKPSDVVMPLMNELGRWKVYSIDESGCLYSKRMVEDEKRRQFSATQGAKGGNPNIKKRRQDNGAVNPPLNAETTTPDNQNPTPSSPSSSSPSDKDNDEEEAMATEKQAKVEGLALLNRHFPHWVMSGEKYRDFLGWEDKLSWILITLAIQETMAAGSRHMGYCDKVLEEWHGEGLRTAEDVKVYQARRKANMDRSKRNQAKGAGQPLAPVQTGNMTAYDPEEILKGH